MSYHALGQAPAATPASPDVSASTPLAQQILTAKRGFVAVPTPDMRDYVQAQLITVGIGFLMGLTVGAVIGDRLRGRLGYQGKHVSIRANRVRRNTSDRSTWMDLADRWASVAASVPGLSILEGEGGFTRVRVSGSRRSFEALRDAVAATAPGVSRTRALARIDDHIKRFL